MKIDEFSSYVLKKAHKPQRFKPFSVYNKEGDCIQFFAKPSPYYRVRLDNVLTVYKSQEGNEIVGCVFKGISSLLTNYPKLTFIFDDGHVRIERLFDAQLAIFPESPQNEDYERLAQVIRGTKVTADLRELCGAAR